MLKVKAGDLDKMGLLFERYHRVLYGFLFHQTNNRFTSEDLTQTVFYRMIKYRNTFSETGEFRTWMYHLARNVLIDNHKKESKMQYKEGFAEFENEMAENKIEQNFIQNEEIEYLKNGLNRLQPDQKEVLVLARFQELSYKEIAEIMETSEGNIKVKVHRAMAALKDILIPTKG